MKKILLIITLLLSLMTFAQDRALFINESFQGTELPEAWSIMGDGANNWSISDTDNAGGISPELKLYWSPGFDGISRVVSTPLNLSGISSLIVTFKHCLQRYSGGCTIGIATSSDGGNSWNSGWTQTYSSSGNYEVNTNVTTSDMGKNNVLFCIYYSGNSENIERWFFDNIMVYSQEDNDIVLTSTTIHDNIYLGEKEVGFSIQNMGISTVETFKARYKVDGSVIAEQNFTTDLATTENASFTFDKHYTFIPGEHTFSLEVTSVNGSNDDDPDNNIISKDISVAMNMVQRIPMIEHFSSSTCSPCVPVNNVMKTLTDNNPGKFTYTKYAMDFPGIGDPYCTEEGLTRKAFYNVSGVPQIYLDGKDAGTPISQNSLDESYNSNAFIDIKGSFDVLGNYVKVVVDIMPYVNISNLNAFVTVNEKTTTGNASSNGETEFHHIMLKMLGGDEGTVININSGEYTRLEFNQHMTSTHIEDKNDLEVAIWIQDMVTKEIFNSSFAYEYTTHPYPVENLRLSKTDDKINVIWDAPEKEIPSSYNVYVNNELMAENITDMSYTLNNAEEFCYVEVFAIYDDKISIGRYETYNPQYQAPENVTAVANENDIDISWDNVSGVKSYLLYRNDMMIKELTANSYNDIDVEAETEYCYRVKAVYNSGSSALSQESCAMIEIIYPCDAPANLNATIEQDAEDYDYNFKVTMSWDAVEYAQNYAVYLDGELLENTTETSLVKGFDEEGEHYFTVATICDNGQSELSEAFLFELIGVSIDELENNFVIYPNPTKDIIKLSSASSQISSVKIYNHLGMSAEEIEVNANEVDINVSDYNSGIYFINIQTENKNIIKKIIIE